MSSRPPSIAGRRDRAQIDAALDAGLSLRRIAQDYSIPKTTLIRYRDSRMLRVGLDPAVPTIRIRVRSSAKSSDAYASDLQPVANFDRTDADDPVSKEQEQEEGEGDHLPPTEAKLREVAKLLAQGASRDEIATRYGVAVSTVTGWHRRIRENGIALVQSATAENIVATLLSNMHQRSAMLWRIANRSEASSPRIAIAAMDSLRKEDQHVAAMAGSLGVLNGYIPQPCEPGSDDEGLPAIARGFMGELAKLLQDDLPGESAQYFDAGSVETHRSPDAKGAGSEGAPDPVCPIRRCHGHSEEPPPCGLDHGPPAQSTGGPDRNTPLVRSNGPRAASRSSGGASTGCGA